MEFFRLLLAVEDRLKPSDAYLYDIEDIGREALSNYAQPLQPRVRNAWFKRDLATFDKAVADFEQLFVDLDALLSSRPELSIPKLINDARSWGSSTEEKNLYETNARGLVTVGGPLQKDNALTIFDYSWREWNGLVKDYYLARWQKFHTFLRGHLAAGTTYSDEELPMAYGREGFLANDFSKALGEWELEWVNTTQPVTRSHGNDAVALATKLFDHYREMIAAADKEAPNPPSWC